jgi:hypothetical protein
LYEFDYEGFVKKFKLLCSFKNILVNFVVHAVRYTTQNVCVNIQKPNDNKIQIKNAKFMLSVAMAFALFGAVEYGLVCSSDKHNKRSTQR